MVKGDGEAKTEILYLDNQPIALQRAIVCRGTTCYRARRPDSKHWEFVVKFSWRSDKRQAEGELLRLARKRKVWGVAQLFCHQDLDSIANLRRDLQFGPPQIFRSVTSRSSSLIRPKTKSSSLTNSLDLSKSTVESSSQQKRKQADERGSVGQFKRPRLSNSQTCEDVKGKLSKEDDETTGNNYSIEKRKNTSLAVSLDGSKFDNRILCCLVVSPRGRAISKFQSVKELLEMFRDAIKGNKSLHQVGRILHRDISENNLIITHTKNEGELRGMVIDLDLAKELDNGPSGARNRTGTIEFMAIEVLQEFEHIKGLAAELRQLLFPIRDEALFTGTYSGAEGFNSMYDGFINAFDKAISACE
ncbi:hypothetical protein RUND412_007232 [Rhizina undulata]